MQYREQCATTTGGVTVTSTRHILLLAVDVEWKQKAPPERGCERVAAPLRFRQRVERHAVQGEKRLSALAGRCQVVALLGHVLRALMRDRVRV